MTTDSDLPPLNIEQIIDSATPLAMILLNTAMATGTDLLSAVAALEAAKRSLMMVGRQNIGEEFYEQAQQLLAGFDGFEETAEAITQGAFTQPGGKS